MKLLDIMKLLINTCKYKNEILKTLIREFQKQVMVKQCYYQNVQYVIAKNQEAKGLLSNLGIRTPLSKVPILGDILFQMCILNCIK